VQNPKSLLVEISGKTGSFSHDLATLFPALSFEVQDPSPEVLSRGEQFVLSHSKSGTAERIRFRRHDLTGPSPTEDLEVEGSAGPVMFLIRGVLWNLPDEAVNNLLQSFIPYMQQHQADGQAPCLLISDLVSPAYGTFEPHIERAFRRRDVTLMTMHNVRQRTATEWTDLISKTDSKFKVKASPLIPGVARENR
jgi:hypothetical protein